MALIQKCPNRFIPFGTQLNKFALINIFFNSNREIIPNQQEVRI